MTVGSKTSVPDLTTAPLSEASFLRRAAGRLTRELREAEFRWRGIGPAERGELSISDVRRLAGERAETIVEIGANVGQHTEQFADAFPDATVYAFEPDPRAWEGLRTRVGDRANVVLEQLAISDADGEATFHVSGGQKPDRETPKPGGWNQSGSLCEPTGHLEKPPWCTFNREVTVRTRTLDSVCDDHGIARIDLLWMDVQGAEALVLRGARQTLRRTRHVYTEYSNRELYAGQPTLLEVARMARGFRVTRRFSKDVLLSNPRADHR